jgi:Papain-like cysteine protease AvrRpt2
MKKRLIFLFLMSFSLNTTFCTAQQLQYVGIPRQSFDFYAASQQKDEWCWAASIQMVLNYYGVNIVQSEIVSRSYGIDPVSGDFPDWPGSYDLITRNLNNWSIDNSGQRYLVSANSYQGAPNPTELVQELSAQRPILVSYMPSPTSGHAVVITGCSFYPMPNGPLIQSIIVRDPWPSAENIQNEGRVEFQAFALAKLMTAHWVIRVNR